MNTRIVGVGVVAAGLLVGARAQAHVTLTNPMNRYGDLAYQNAYQKSSPCGHADNPPGDQAPVVYQAGETITITIDEYVQHEGFFRVAVAGSDQDFIAPTSVDDIGDDPNTVLVMADEQSGGEHQIEVTLPDTPCDPCVLQFIQVMTAGGNFNDNYYQCADIVIEGSVPSTGGEETTGGGDTEGTTGDGGSDGTTSTSTSTSGSDAGSASASGSSPSTGPDGGSSGEDTDVATTTGDAMPDASSESDGCSCRSTPRGSTAMPWALLALFATVRRRARRRRARPSALG